MGGGQNGGKYSKPLRGHEVCQKSGWHKVDRINKSREDQLHAEI